MPRTKNMDFKLGDYRQVVSLSVIANREYTCGCSSSLRQPSRQKEKVMTNTAQRNMTTIVLWSTAWALALIASAILLKGNPVKEWVQAALFIGCLTVSL